MVRLTPSRRSVDLIAIALTCSALILVAAAMAGFNVRVSCNPFSLEDPYCSFVASITFILLVGLLFVAWAMGIAWLRWRTTPLALRLLWLPFFILLFPYAVLSFYWFVYRGMPKASARAQGEMPSVIGPNRQALDQWRKDSATIDRLISTGALQKVAANDDRWEVLYLAAADGQYWLLDFPLSEMQGGGPRRLRKISREEAHERFGLDSARTPE